jgi:hypothetical protein
MVHIMVVSPGFLRLDAVALGDAVPSCVPASAVNLNCTAEAQQSFAHFNAHVNQYGLWNEMTPVVFSDPLLNFRIVGRFFHRQAVFGNQLVKPG